jgi:hypothetical protein
MTYIGKLRLVPEPTIALGLAYLWPGSFGYCNVHLIQ